MQNVAFFPSEREFAGKYLLQSMQSEAVETEKLDWQRLHHGRISIAETDFDARTGIAGSITALVGEHNPYASTRSAFRDRGSGTRIEPFHYCNVSKCGSLRPL